MIDGVLDRDVLSFEIEKSCIDEKKVIGSFQKNPATIELLNPDNKYSNLKSTYINTYKGTFYVDNIEPVQEKIKIKLNCYDLTQKFEKAYDSSKFVFPLTLKAWRNAICTELGIEYDNTDFPNSDYELSEEPYIKKDATYKDIIKLIAQASSCWAIIDYDDKLYFNWFNNTLIEVQDWFDLTTEDEPTDPVNIAVLGRGDVEDNVVYPETEPTNPKEIRIDSNDILDLNRKEMIVPIYNQVKDFKYTVFSMKTIGFSNAKIGNKIKYPDLYTNKKESYIMHHTLTFLGGDYSDSRNYTSQFEAVELDETNTNYKYAESTEERLDKTERLTDKLGKQISDVIETVGQYDSKISEVEQSVDKISQKVSEIADLTREISSNRYVEVNDAIAGNLISLTISGEMSILPSKNIYPSENLFPHDAFYLKVTNGEESIRYKLPFYVLHRYGDVKDEFIIDNGKTKLIKRIGVDKDDNKYVLTNPIEQTFDDITIPLTDGYNKIELVDFSNAMLNMKYAIQSEYSNVFATKAELSSSITQTKDEINLEVKKKVDDDEIISTINQSAEQVKINANKISLEGKQIDLTSDNITIESTNFKVDKNGKIEATDGVFKGKIEATDGNVGGWNINSDGLKKGNIFIKNSGYANVYTAADIYVLKAMIYGESWASMPTAGSSLFNRYDINKDGQINITDLQLLSRILELN
nr:MAG TPA: hypothetical protein [Caudoviricetes sp.]